MKIGLTIKMKYKDLSKFEKMCEIRKLLLSKNERHNAAVYLKALWVNNRKVIEEYESFGNTAYIILMNKRYYDRGLSFGFTEKIFNEYGHLDNAKFTDVEKIEFPHGKGKIVSNSISIGKGVNGKWTYGIRYSTGGSGGAYGIGIWGNIYDSREECLSDSLQELMNAHCKNKTACKNDPANFNSALSREVMKRAKDIYDMLTKRNTVQLSLF
ncbi:hypothetical protein EZS27_003915 [termite gut metagenome]|uniref:Uncharacterized protein n=1 Tax=termite gut metagenome TaxID=433724 RepID=A0A5J4SS91_9ZZZZ